MARLDFSIVVPYGGGGDLCLTLDSIASQSAVSLEIIVVTKANSKVYVPSQFKNFTKIIEEARKGVFGALNTGLDNTNSAYTYFITSGASFTSNQVLSKIKKILTSESDCIYVNGGWIQERTSGKSSKFAGISINHFYHFWSIQQMNVEALCVRNSSTSNLRFDEHFRIAADFKFLRTLTKLGKGHALQEIFVRLPPPGISGSISALGDEELDEIRIETLSDYFGNCAKIMHVSIKYIIRYTYLLKSVICRLSNTVSRI